MPWNVQSLDLNSRVELADVRPGRIVLLQQQDRRLRNGGVQRIGRWDALAAGVPPRHKGCYESPEGPAIEVPVRTGTPRLGEPSEFQLIF
ncbi:hypothetical protein Aph01nite_36500 [Acrocarpospora phusangensis]|uniref:Uncharacterized protein n=1 Tax=Acrocarpospora phusangensis TaxID=1070424 RepID=A0A919URA6_9ACTN|nr:hypothetical protein Aph01nite_36500 [Acrocarpospora phusangensis]